MRPRRPTTLLMLLVVILGLAAFDYFLVPPRTSTVEAQTVDIVPSHAQAPNGPNVVEEVNASFTVEIKVENEDKLYVGDSVKFEAVVETLAGDPVIPTAVVWDFAGLSVGYDMKTSFKFPAAGDYTVTVQVQRGVEEAVGVKSVNIKVIPLACTPPDKDASSVIPSEYTTYGTLTTLAFAPVPANARMEVEWQKHDETFLGTGRTAALAVYKLVDELPVNTGKVDRMWTNETSEWVVAKVSPPEGCNWEPFRRGRRVYITDQSISGLNLEIRNDAKLDHVLYMTATATTGTNISFLWPKDLPVVEEDGAIVNGYSESDDALFSYRKVKYPDQGDYEVSVTAINSVNVLTVNRTAKARRVRQPKSIFDNSPKSVDTPITFVVLGVDSRDDASFQWNFGDGKISTDGSPVDHAYELAGRYNVTVDVTSDGITETVSTIAYVEVEKKSGNVAITVEPDDQQSFGEVLKFCADPQTGLSYDWNFGVKSEANISGNSVDGDGDGGIVEGEPHCRTYTYKTSDSATNTNRFVVSVEVSVDDNDDNNLYGDLGLELRDISGTGHQMTRPRKLLYLPHVADGAIDRASRIASGSDVVGDQSAPTATEVPVPANTPAPPTSTPLPVAPTDTPVPPTSTPLPTATPVPVEPPGTIPQPPGTIPQP